MEPPPASLAGADRASVRTTGSSAPRRKVQSARLMSNAASPWTIQRFNGQLSQIGLGGARIVTHGSPSWSVPVWHLVIEKAGARSTARQSPSGAWTKTRCTRFTRDSMRCAKSTWELHDREADTEAGRSVQGTFVIDTHDVAQALASVTRLASDRTPALHGPTSRVRIVSGRRRQLPSKSRSHT